MLDQAVEDADSADSGRNGNRESVSPSMERARWPRSLWGMMSMVLPTVLSAGAGRGAGIAQASRGVITDLVPGLAWTAAMILATRTWLLFVPAARPGRGSLSRRCIPVWRGSPERAEFPFNSGSQQHRTSCGTAGSPDTCSCSGGQPLDDIGAERAKLVRLHHSFDLGR